MIIAGVWTRVGFSNLKNWRTRILTEIHTFWNRSGVGVWKSDSGHLCFIPEMSSDLDWIRLDQWRQWKQKICANLYYHGSKKSSFVCVLTESLSQSSHLLPFHVHLWHGLQLWPRTLTTWAKGGFTQNPVTAYDQTYAGQRQSSNRLRWPYMGEFSRFRPASGWLKISLSQCSRWWRSCCLGILCLPIQTR